jgi:scyllo-inositol 2-dehydrogenase (NADP+)
MASADSEQVRCAVIGYGGAFNMGRNHLRWINAAPGLTGVAVCDLDSERLREAEADFPGIRTYRRVEDLLADQEVELVTVITPHNTHAPLAIQCSRAGKHVIVEKPMCLTVAEADEMIAAGRAAGRMVSVFHNRRWDGDHLTMRSLIEEGILGDVFHIEANGGGWSRPDTWWRSDKAISGGAFYDWGAHIIDWVLHLKLGPLHSVLGFFHKRVWAHVTNEDHTQAILRWSDGAYADVQISSIARAPKPRFRILGTRGAILDDGRGELTVYGEVAGRTATFTEKYRPSDWQEYYNNVANHLLRGAPLAVTPESARRVIAVIETAERSSRSGQALPVPHEAEPV